MSFFYAAFWLSVVLCMVMPDDDDFSRLSLNGGSFMMEFGRGVGIVGDDTLSSGSPVESCI